MLYMWLCLCGVHICSICVIVLTLCNVQCAYMFYICDCAYAMCSVHICPICVIVLMQCAVCIYVLYICDCVRVQGTLP